MQRKHSTTESNVPLLNSVHLDCLFDLENTMQNALGVIKYTVFVN